MGSCFIGIGSNLNDPAGQIRLAVKRLQNIPQSRLTRISSLYSSKPMGPQDQPDYMNAVAEVETSLSPIRLLDELQAIESDAGRERKGDRWGARVLDLDIILFGNKAINTDRLTVPHYGMKEREFVLIPLLEIAPSLKLPSGESVETLAKTIDQNSLTIIDQLS